MTSVVTQIKSGIGSVLPYVRDLDKQRFLTPSHYTHIQTAFGALHEKCNEDGIDSDLRLSNGIKDLHLYSGEIDRLDDKELCTLAEIHLFKGGTYLHCLSRYPMLDPKRYIISAMSHSLVANFLISILLDRQKQGFTGKTEKTKELKEINEAIDALKKSTTKLIIALNNFGVDINKLWNKKTVNEKRFLDATSLVTTSTEKHFDKLAACGRPLGPYFPCGVNSNDSFNIRFAYPEHMDRLRNMSKPSLITLSAIYSSASLGRQFIIHEQMDDLSSASIRAVSIDNFLFGTGAQMPLSIARESN